MTAYKLPERKVLVHKPIEPRNLSKSKLEDYTEDSEWLWQLKYDGCHMIVVVCDGKGYAFSRTGEPVSSCDHIVKALEVIPGASHYVYFGEAYDYGMIHSRINGAFRAKEPATWLKFLVFDGVPLEDFHKGVCEIQYFSRLEFLRGLFCRYAPHNVTTVHTFAPSRLTSTEALIDEVRSHGYPYELDGYVAKKRNGIWQAGAGTAGAQIKVKNHLSLDLRCVGLVEGKGKFEGMVGAVKVEYKGQVLEIGGGKMTDFERQVIWGEKDILVGRIVEVHALASSTHGKLREPRFIRVRHDKDTPD